MLFVYIAVFYACIERPIWYNKFIMVKYGNVFCRLFYRISVRKNHNWRYLL